MLKTESLYVLVVKVPVLKRIQHRENRDCVKVSHVLKLPLFNLDLHVVVNFLFEQPTELEFNVRLEPLARLDCKVLPLCDL